MRIVVMGAGGLGSVIGGYLALAGAEVTLIARPAHVEAIRARGLLIKGIRGEKLVRERLLAYTSAAEAPGEYDWFILGVKAKDTEQALRDAEPLRTRVRQAFSLQNSIVKDDQLIAWLQDPTKVVGFATIEGGKLEAPGVVINHLTVPTTAYVGELDGRMTERVRALANLFNQADLGCRAVPNIKQVEWEKLAQICLASGWAVTTLAGKPDLNFADGLAVREGAEHFVALGRDILNVYHALGYQPQNFFAPISRLKEINEMPFEEAVDFFHRMGLDMKARGFTGTTSMHEDVRRGRKTEVDYIIAPFVQESRQRALETPVLMTVYRIIKTLDHYLA